MTADTFANPVFVLQQELDAAFPPDDSTASGSEAPHVDLRPQPDTPRETEALPNSAELTPHPVFARFADAMRSSASPEHLSAAHSWLSDLRQLDGPLENVPIAHGYNMMGYWEHFDEPDRPILTHFLNKMAEGNVPEEFVHGAIRWYLDGMDQSSGVDLVDAQLSREDARSIEEMDLQDREQARGALREQWGPEYDANIHLANGYLDTLPASQRAFYESADDSGTLRLNRPDVLARLAQEARAQVPPVLVEAARQHGSERAALEAMMADRYSPYYKGADAAALQARYRDLLRAGDDQPKPLPTGSGIAQEIAAIERTMREDRHRYNKDEQMQARLRQLYTLTGV